MLIRNQAEMPRSGKILKDPDKALFIYIYFEKACLCFIIYRIFGLPFRRGDLQEFCLFTLRTIISAFGAQKKKCAIDTAVMV